EVAKLIREGILTPERAQKYPRRNVLLSALGGNSSYQLFLTEFEWIAGDRLLLLSDGVYKILAKSQIASISASCQSLDKFVEDLEKKLKTTGLVDDASLLAAEFL
ncbi:PP2C family protein-serine/threonine phosphatase, partial [Roseateles sp. P5_E11]